MFDVGCVPLPCRVLDERFVKRNYHRKQTHVVDFEGKRKMHEVRLELRAALKQERVRRRVVQIAVGVFALAKQWCSVGVLQVCCTIFFTSGNEVVGFAIEEHGRIVFNLKMEAVNQSMIHRAQSTLQFRRSKMEQQSSGITNNQTAKVLCPTIVTIHHQAASKNRTAEQQASNGRVNFRYQRGPKFPFHHFRV